MILDHQKLTDFVQKIVMHAGLDEHDAAIFADSLVFADMRGVSSHGVTRLRIYRERLLTGQVDASAKPETLNDRPSFLMIDGHNGMGAPLAFHAMQQCIERAKVTGACFAAVRGGNHFGCAGYFTKYAAAHGMIGFAVSDSSAVVPPTGSKEPMLGTNPLSVSIPAFGMDPFLLDMATSVVANGKIKLALKEGHEIPAGWGMDENGQITVDPAKVKFLLPFGGYKGYGVSMAIDILCSVLAGAADSHSCGSFWTPGDGKVQGIGFFVGALNPAAVTDPTEFQKGVARYIGEMKSAECADGVDEVLVAGEIEQRKYDAAVRDGVNVSDVVAAELKKLAEACGVPFDVEK